MYAEWDTTEELNMYTIRNTVGEFFEKKIAKVFGLYTTNAAKAGKRVLDLSTKDNCCAFECKAGFKSSGGIILEKQINPVQRPLPWINMFYVFGYHTLRRIQKNYGTEEELLTALDSNITSYHIIPEMIVSAYFKSKVPRNITARNGSVRDRYVPMPESNARKIFYEDQRIWAQMKLSPDKFHTISPHEKVFVTAQSPEMLETLLKHFDSKNV